MARPSKRRRICLLPQSIGLAPEGEAPDTLVMLVDEYETIRLIDLEGLTQAQCAAQMKVARATVTSIYDSARSKLADALVNGKRLVVSGGHVMECENYSVFCCGTCGKGECETCLRPCKNRGLSVL